MWWSYDRVDNVVACLRHLTGDSSTAGAKRKIEEIMAKGDRLAPFPDFVDEDEDEYGECSCSCGFGKEHEKLFRYLMQVMVILKVVDENMEALYRKQMEIKELLALITSLQTKLASVKPQLTFIEMEGVALFVVCIPCSIYWNRAYVSRSKVLWEDGWLQNWCPPPPGVLWQETWQSGTPWITCPLGKIGQQGLFYFSGSPRALGESDEARPRQYWQRSYQSKMRLQLCKLHFNILCPAFLHSFSSLPS